MAGPRQFCCARCGRECVSEWSEEEARVEQKLNGFAGDDCVQICDECYRQFMAWYRAQAN